MGREIRHVPENWEHPKKIIGSRTGGFKAVYRPMYDGTSFEEAVKEFKKYSYKIDRLTGEITSDIVDANNHYIDSIRYALEKAMKRSGGLRMSSKLKDKYR